jgi:hypothetical protein
MAVPHHLVDVLLVGNAKSRNVWSSSFAKTATARARLSESIRDDPRMTCQEGFGGDVHSRGLGHIDGVTTLNYLQFRIKKIKVELGPTLAMQC